MKVRAFYVFFTCVAAFGLLVAKEIHFLTYKRSGTHWFGYIMTQLLQRQLVWGKGRNDDQPFQKYWTINDPQGVIFSGHVPKRLELGSSNQEDDVLIVIIRNYRESFLRQHGYCLREIKKAIKESAQFSYLDKEDQCYSFNKIDYINTLRCYDKWNPKNRFLIYYEDLLTQPEKELRRFCEFFSIAEELLQDFLKNIEFHKSLTLKMYDETQKGARSRGEDLLFHSEKIGLRDCQFIDYAMEYFFPYYYQKYLQRYAIKITN